MAESQVMLACTMIRKEIEVSLEATDYPWPIVWMEKGLHEFPDKLRGALQEEINKWDGKVTYIVMGYGLCGLGLIGLKAEKSILVIPKFDDCIRMLLSHEENKPIRCNPRTLYYTAGWMEDDMSSVLSRRKYEEKYGEKKAKRILKVMLAGYTSVTLIDTGLYDIEAAKDKLSPDASYLELGTEVVPGSLRLFEKMLRCEWDGEFIVTKPGEAVAEGDFAGRTRCVYD